MPNIEDTVKHVRELLVVCGIYQNDDMFILNMSDFYLRAQREQLAEDMKTVKETK